MDSLKVIFLRQYLVTNIHSKEIVTMEYSYDTGAGGPPRFFVVPDQDLAAARAHYTEWGGIRPEGHGRGSIARRPVSPLA